MYVHSKQVTQLASIYIYFTQVTQLVNVCIVYTVYTADECIFTLYR